ncbi:MAG: plasmid recombination protein [Prevotella sp.]|nr:plasmid recombination protein [Prevotella sp.]
MAYCVFTCKKPERGAADGGLSAHIDREKWDGKEHKMVPFVPKSVIHPELSHLNKEYLLPSGMGRSEAIEKRIREAGITRKIRDDQAKFLAFVCSSDSETMRKIYDEGRWQAWVDANISFMQKTFGRENVVACAGHMDEVTFHLHFTVVPILTGQAAERPDTKKQFEKRNGKEKRRYRKQEVTARLCARDVFTQENAERWQTEYALHMQAAGFDLERGVQGSKAKHMDPAIYNAIKAEEAKLEAEKDGLKMQKEVLEDEVDTLQSEKDALTIEVETLNREKKQAETAVKGLQTMCRNLASQKAQLTSDLDGLQNQLSAGKISLDEYNRKKADVEKQIFNCDVKLTDKQQKLEQKTAELQVIKEKVNYYDVAYVRFDVPEIKVRPPQIMERPPRFGNIDDWTKAQNATISKQFHDALNSFGKTVMEAAKNSILGERKFRLLNQRERDAIGEELQSIKYLRLQQIHETLGLLALFEKPDTAKLVREVAVALMGGRYVSIPCAGGGSVSSETGWDGRRKNEEEDSFRLRCWLHAAKTVKASRYLPTKRKGYGR